MPYEGDAEIERVIEAHAAWIQGETLATELRRMSGEEEGRSLSIRVTDGDRVVTSDLYQLGKSLRDQFAGGHGFTGLRDAYGADGSEVQWWCTAG